MEDNRKEVDPSGQELIEDEQSGESVRPLVADQNVNPSADEIRKAKKRAADKKYHDGQKRKIEDMERQSKKMRADYDELKGLHFYITGKLEQALADMEQIKEGYWSLQKVVKQQEALINMLQTPLPSFGVGDQGSTSFNEDLNWFLDGCTASVEYHKSEIESVLEPISHD